MHCPGAGACRRASVRMDGAADFSFSALRREAARRGSGANLGKFDMLRKIGPHDQTSPRQVIEHVIVELQAGNLSQAFTFTSMPPWRQGVHKSTTDWTQRMAWDKSTIIEGTPSGRTVTLSDFEEMVRTRYGSLLQTEQYRFIGDSSPWQMKDGRAKPTAEKEYMVELRMRNGEHQIVRFKLVYDWLLYCHLVATCTLQSVTISKHFPGAEDTSLIDI